jgi:signal transduction histidine kinase
MSALLPESSVEDSPWERRSRSRSPYARWIGWRLRALVAAALVGCLALFLLLRALAALPALEARLTADERGTLRLAGRTTAPELVALRTPDGALQPVDALLLQRSSRWLADDADRVRQARQHDALAAALAVGSVHFIDREGQEHALAAEPRGALGLGWMFWPLALLALLLYLVTMIVLLARPEPRNILYAAMALAQMGNLLFLAVLSTPALGWPAGFMHWEQAARSSFDLVTAAALLHTTGVHPRRVPGSGWRAGVGWLLAAALAIALVQGLASPGWWWTQAALVAYALVAIAQLAWMQRHQPHPLALQLLRFCAVAVGTLVLLTLTVPALGPVLDARGQAAAIGSTVWTVFVAAMLLMWPFMARTQQLMREFALLAGVSTVATALDLLFVAMFSLGNFASLTLALFLSLGVYAGVRQWLLNTVLARERLTTERMFEHLYRMAREVQADARGAGEPLARLLRELFEPLDVHVVARRAERARVLAEGASLVVPVPALGAATPGHGAVVLGFAERGRRLFTEDDARLADRIVDQLARAVAFDQAVERGRSEERVRIAQDLHDDIGARLLTLMYQAPTPEMEDYLRHTLKDLKTLTRGLAAPSHPLSHAVAEWKADLTQRLGAADCELGWTFACERDFELSVVQWSALTRVLRELVSNTLAHARATRVDIEASIEQGTLQLTVADNGVGRTPEAWSHGLGLGGVRKRVKQLGGSVAWHENEPRGIVCRVRVPAFAPPAAEPPP